jgi:hypothetical protein
MQYSKPTLYRYTSSGRIRKQSEKDKTGSPKCPKYHAVLDIINLLTTCFTIYGNALSDYHVREIEWSKQQQQQQQMALVVDIPVSQDVLGKS